MLYPSDTPSRLADDPSNIRIPTTGLRQRIPTRYGSILRPLTPPHIAQPPLQDLLFNVRTVGAYG